MQSCEVTIGSEKYRLADFRALPGRGGDYVVMAGALYDADDKPAGEMQFRFSTDVFSNWLEPSLNEANDRRALLQHAITAIAPAVAYPPQTNFVSSHVYHVQLMTGSSGQPDIALSPDGQSCIIHSHGTAKDLVKQLVYGGQYRTEDIRREILRYVYYDEAIDNPGSIVGVDDMQAALLVPERLFVAALMQLVTIGYLKPVTRYGSITPALVSLTKDGLMEHDESLKNTGAVMNHIKNQVNNYGIGGTNHFNTTIIEQVEPSIAQLRQLIDDKLAAEAKAAALHDVNELEEHIEQGNKEQAVASAGKLAGIGLGLEAAGLVATIIGLIAS